MHNGPIYTMLYDDKAGAIYSAGGPEGIYCWNLHFDKNQFMEDSKRMLAIIQKESEKLEAVKTKKIIEENENKENIMQNLREFNDMNFDESSPQPIVLTKTPEKLEQLQFNEKTSNEFEIDTSKQSKLGKIIPLKLIDGQSKSEPNLSKTKLPKTTELGLTHYLNLNEQLPDFKSKNLVYENSLTLKNISGVNTNTSFGFIWNPQSKDLIYLNENKLIIESLNNSRSQRIFHLSQILTCIKLSADCNYLFIGTCANSLEHNAPVYILNLNDLSWNKIEKHKKGVQNLAISADSTILISIGTAIDKRMIMYSCFKKTVILDCFMEHPSYDCFVEINQKTNSYFLGVTSKNSVRLYSVDAYDHSQVKSIDACLNHCKLYDVEINCCVVKLLDEKANIYQMIFGTSNKQVLVLSLNYERNLNEKCFKILQKLDLFDSEIVQLKLAGLKKTKLIVASSEGKLTF